MLLNSITHEFVSIVNVNILKIFDALGDIFDRSRNYSRLLNKLDNFKKSHAKNEFSRFFRRKGKKEISALFTVRLTHSRRREEKEFRQVRNGNRLLCFRAENSRPPGLVCVFEIVKFELYHPLNSVTRTPFRRRRNNRGLISSRHYRVSAILFQPLVNSPPSFRGRKKSKKRKRSRARFQPSSPRSFNRARKSRNME